jgi:hypothetical protein
LVAATLGNPPFRRGPWPERRFAEDNFAQLSPELDAAVKGRSRQVARALKVCPNQISLSASIGNVDGITRMREHYRGMCGEFQQVARELAQSAKAFSDSFQVFDDTALWNLLLASSEQWRTRMESSLVKQEHEVQDAMKAAAASSRSSDKEIDLDNFPSGDDPF